MRSRSGPGNGVEHVRGGDEHHAGQVERHRQIIVAERVVLLRVEHFEQRRAGIALDAGAELVDLVEHHHAVARAGLADRLDDVAGQRADIGAAVAADLRLVVHAAEADAHEFAVHGARDRLAERGLADAGRADEAQDRRLALRRELAHGEIFDDAALDLVEAVVVLVEDVARLGDVDRLFLGQASTAARSASRDRCAPCRIRRRLRACAAAGAVPCAPGPRPPSACRPWRWPRRARRSPRPCPPRLRRAGAGSPPSARAAAPRAGARRARPWSAGRSPATAAAPRCGGRAAARPCPCARRCRWSRGSPASPPASRPCRRSRDRRAPAALRSTAPRRAAPPAPAAAARCASRVCALQIDEPRLDLRRAQSPARECAARARPGTASRSRIRRSGSAARPGRRDDACRPAR